jgi:hypothetical protein
VLLFSLINASYASSYLGSLMMPAPIASGKMSFSMGIEYFTATESLKHNLPNKPEWAPLKDCDVDSTTSLAIPFKFAYGVTNDLSVRVTIPFVTNTMMGTWAGNFSGSGIGDAWLEAFYRFMDEGDAAPSVAADLNIKFANGKYRTIVSDEFPLGTGGGDVYFSAIFGKKLGPVNGKALLVYALMGKIDTPLLGHVIIEPASQILFSLDCAYPIGKGLELGGELWGNSYGEEKLAQGGNTLTVDYSGRTQIFLSPYISFMPSPALTLRAAIDYPVSVPPAWDFVNYPLSLYKGITLSISASYSI